MASLQELLTQQPPTTSGVHEAMAQHAEDTFTQLGGILPLFVGKRKKGNYLTFALPNAVTQDNGALLQTLSDIIFVYDLKLASFMTAIRTRVHESSIPKLGALLMTADDAKALFQLPWELEFDSASNLVNSTRSSSDGEIIPRSTWEAFFARTGDLNARQVVYETLIQRFGSQDQLPPISLTHVSSAVRPMPLDIRLPQNAILPPPR
ncbi:MAG: hypothetical protein AAGB46_02715 [Verrucomicrobiota bacterium]